MAIELTTASDFELSQIRASLKAASLTGNELFVGTKTFTDNISAKDIFCRDASLRDTIVRNVTSNDVLVKSNLNSNDTVTQNLTVLGRFISDVARFYEPPTSIYIDYNSSEKEYFILTPSPVNYLPILVDTPGAKFFPTILNEVNKTFVGDLILTRNDNTRFKVGAVDILNGDIVISEQPILNTLVLTGIKVANNITVAGIPNLTQIKMDELTVVKNLRIASSTASDNNSSVKQIIFPKLKFILNSATFGPYAFFNTFGDPGGYGTAAVSILNMGELVQVKEDLNLAVSTNSLLFPKLESVRDLVIYNTSLSSLNSQNFPLLTQIRDLKLNNIANLREINIPSLEIGGYYIIANALSLTSFEIPNIKIIDERTSGSQGVTFFNCPSVTKVNLGTGQVKHWPSTINISSVLDQNSVDTLLSEANRLDGFVGTDRFEGNLSLVGRNSPPSFTGTKYTLTPGIEGVSYSKQFYNVFVTKPLHGLSTGQLINIEALTSTSTVLSSLVNTHTSGTYRVSVIDSNNFSYSAPTSANFTGDSLSPLVLRTTTNTGDGFYKFMTYAERISGFITVFSNQNYNRFRSVVVTLP